MTAVHTLLPLLFCHICVLNIWKVYRRYMDAIWKPYGWNMDAIWMVYGCYIEII
jgi:hypothetical protein